MDVALGRPLRDGIGFVAQTFGDNPSNYQAYNLAGHEGLDYGCPVGSEILAAHDGFVEQAHEEGAYGKHIVIRGSGLKTVYAHLSEFCVIPGEPVKRGQVIAKSGNTGRSTGPHLHFGFQIAGVRNPAYQDWLDPLIGRIDDGYL